MGLSVQYTGFGATREIEAFRVWNRARDLDDFVFGLQLFDVGSQNFAYADVDGNIAYFTSAEMPLREDLAAGTVHLVPPFFIRDGTGELTLLWFKGWRYLPKVIKKGALLAVSGQITYFRGLQITHPDFEILEDWDAGDLTHTGRVIPVYPSGEAWRAAHLESGLASVTDDFVKTEILLELAELWDVSELEPERAERAYQQLILALGDFEFHLLTFGEIAVAFGHDDGLVDEYVRTAFTLDETKAFFSVEPLDRAGNTF